MEISSNSENLNSDLTISENLDNSNTSNTQANPNTDSNIQLTNFIKDRTHLLVDNKDTKKKPKAEQDFLGLIENSSLELSSLNLSKEITSGIKEFGFDAGIDQWLEKNTEEFNFKILRKKSHAQIVLTCAHAAYFVGIANRIRRNVEDIKNGVVKQKNSMLLNEMKKIPGLHVGIIGGGKLGRQLARSLLEYSEVYPNELQISTRQPELLNELTSKNVRCFYDNRKLAGSVNILFLCVLPSQLPTVINDIRKNLPDKCIIYSLVRPINGMQLRNLIHENISKSFILRPEYEFTEKLYDSNLKWNYSLDIIESLSQPDMIAAINPFNGDEGLITMGNHTRACFIYAMINICSFLGLEKQETLIALRNFLFFSTNKYFKLDETFFYDQKNESLYLPIVDLVDIANGQSAFSNKLDHAKSIRKCLSKNYLDFFDETNAWKTRTT